MSDRRLIAAILNVMEWDRAYEASSLKAMFPDISMDTLREALHSLWVSASRGAEPDTNSRMPDVASFLRPEC